MKELFHEHFKSSKEEAKQLWTSCTFIFDANILLNLYRYSDATRQQFFNLLESIEDRVWLPNRAVEEYFNNRLKVIGDQEKAYDTATQSILELQKKLTSTRQHPFVEKKTMSKAQKVFTLLTNELKENKKIHSKRISTDEIQDSISQIFDKKVGSPYQPEQIETLIKEGERRYNQQIPPGFKDGGKLEESDSLKERSRKFGDYILWQQVIDYATTEEKSIILVTDDKKEDWWRIFNGKTIGPRPELVKEFCGLTNQKFYMYQADRFMELAHENLGTQVSSESLEEVRAIRKDDLKQSNSPNKNDRDFTDDRPVSQLITNYIENKQRHLKIEEQISSLTLEVDELEHERHAIILAPNKGDKMRNLAALSERIGYLREEIRLLEESAANSKPSINALQEALSRKVARRRANSD